MSEPPDSGGQPPAPISTPAAASHVQQTPTMEHPSGGKSWSTIPGLGSAVKPPESTPRRVSHGGPALTSAGAPASLRRFPPLSIDAPSMAAVPPNKNVGIAPKTAGAAPANWQSFMDKRGATSAVPTAVAASASTSTTWPVQGLGSTPRSFSGTQGAAVSTKATAVHFTQTEEYHKAAAPTCAPTVPSAATAPLPQTGFPALPDRQASAKDDSSSGAFTEPSSSEISTGLTEDYLKDHSKQVELTAETWTEADNPRGLRHALRDWKAEWEESYAGALHALNQLNPAQFVMPPGTRIVNIKTDHAQNILASIRESKYAAIEKVTERIMAVYKARENAHEKVLFLFSVNASKKFCGLAEMVGDWDPAGSIEGWTENPEGNKVHGAIPVTWIFAKDVAYSHFNDIRQIHNGHPVGNMWNGMNFPSETGREVIERYVITPSTASVLGYPRNYPENFGIMGFRQQGDGNSDTRSSVSQRSRGSFTTRGTLRGGRGMSRGGLGIPDWRGQGPEAATAVRENVEDDSTPTAANFGRTVSTNRTMAHKPMTDQESTAPSFSMDDIKNAPVADTAALLSGVPVSFVMGQDGRLMVVPGTKSSALPSTSSDQKGSVFDEHPLQSTRLQHVHPSANRGGMGFNGRGGPQAVIGRPSRSIQPSHPAGSHPMGHEQSPPVAMLQQAAIFAAHQEARSQYQPAPFENSWNYHSQQMNSLGFHTGFQAHRSFGSRARTTHDAHMRHGSGDGYDELPTPTHRPPPHGTRLEPANEIPTTYRSVPEWQSDKITHMGPLQLKAYFFTLAAEQHIIEHQSMQPTVTSQGMETLRARVRRIGELKREIHEELYFIGHNLFEHPLDSQDFNTYQPELNVYGQQQRISPVRDDNGRVLPSASETSMSPPDIWGTYPQQRPTQLFGLGGGHQQHHATQSAASMMGGGVQVGERRGPA